MPFFFQVGSGGEWPQRKPALIGFIFAVCSFFVYFMNFAPGGPSTEEKPRRSHSELYFFNKAIM